MQQLRVLVSGGAGFLGSHLCEKLVSQGHDVLCVDNYFSGRKQNIAHLLGFPNFETVRHDVTFPLYVEVDEIYNLACPASPKIYQTDPVQTLKTSVHGAINLLGLAKRTGAKILQASTSEIYGDPIEHPQTEAYTGNVRVDGPRACYDEGKRCAETLFHDYRRQHGVNIKIMRIFNVYGPRMLLDDGRVVSNFIHQSLTGKPITIYGSGEQTRSFCYVDDMISAMVSIMNLGPEVCGPINVGNPHEVTVIELARKINELVGGSSALEFFQEPQDDPKRRCPDISLMRSLTGWEPSFGLHSGLLRTIEDCRKKLQIDQPIRPLTRV